MTCRLWFIVIEIPKAGARVVRVCDHDGTVERCEHVRYNITAERRA